MKFEKEEQENLIEIVQQIPDQSLELNRSITPHRGHKLFKMRKEGNEIIVEDVIYDKSSYFIFNPKWKKGDPIKGRAKVVMEEGWQYETALNKRNASKKFKD